MTRLIDADALLEAMRKEDVLKVYECIQLVNNALTVQREGWISVKNRFPKDYQYVIALEDDGEIYKLMFTTNQEGNFWRDIHDYYYHNVTHWMPLPTTTTAQTRSNEDAI